MKIKFEPDSYKETYMENDIEMVEKIKRTMEIKAIIALCLWCSMGIFVLFDFCNVFYVKLLFLSFSILLLSLTYFSLTQYNQNKILKLLIKNYFVRAVMCIWGITMNGIGITLLFFNNPNPELWITFICCLSVITLAFSYFVNSKYMGIKNTETTIISTITGTCITYLIVRYFNDFMMFILVAIIIIIVVSSLSEHIIRSIRLLKYAPEDVLEHTE